MSLARRVRGPRDLPDAGACLPAIAVRVGFVLVATALTVVGYGFTGWVVAGAVLGVAGAVWPESLLAWVLILFLAGGALMHHAALSARFLVLLAGLHLVHVLAMLGLELPATGWVHAGVFSAPLRRWLAIQIPAQLFAVLMLLLFAPDRGGHRPVTAGVFGVLGALALAGVSLLLLGDREQAGDRGESPHPEPDQR